MNDEERKARQREYTRRYRERLGKEERNRREALYRTANRERLREIGRRSYQKHRDKNVAAAREYKKRTDYYHKNKDHIDAYAKEWRHRNPERARAATNRWYERNKEKRTVHIREYVAQNRERYRVWINNYFARKAGAEGRHIPEEWEAKKAEYAHCCAYCGAKPAVLEQEHVIPLSRGGSDDISNIVPACRSCNSKKHTRTADEFAAARRAA